MVPPHTPDRIMKYVKSYMLVCSQLILKTFILLHKIVLQNQVMKGGV